MAEHGLQARAREYLGAFVEASRRGGGRASSAEWSLDGVRQTARVERIPSIDAETEVHLMVTTVALAGFTGAPGQLAVLAARVPPAKLAGLVRSSDAASRLDLMSSLHARAADIDWALRALAAAAHAQVDDAQSLLADARAFAGVGLTPAGPADDGPETTARAPAIDQGTGRQIGAGAWTVADLAACADTLRLRDDVRAVETPWGISATIWPGGMSRACSVLEVRAGVERPRVGRGLSIVLRTPVRGGPLRAIAWNEREAGAGGRGQGLGGWWAPEGGFMVHTAFYPDSLQEEGRALSLLMTCLHRAEDALAASGLQIRL